MCHVQAVVTEIKRMHKTGRPVLVGTTSVEKSELLSAMLTEAGIKHQVRQGDKEGETVRHTASSMAHVHMLRSPGCLQYCL